MLDQIIMRMSVDEEGVILMRPLMRSRPIVDMIRMGQSWSGHCENEC